MFIAHREDSPYCVRFFLQIYEVLFKVCFVNAVIVYLESDSTGY